MTAQRSYEESGVEPIVDSTGRTWDYRFTWEDNFPGTRVYRAAGSNPPMLATESVIESDFVQRTLA